MEQISTLASVYHKPADTFVSRQRLAVQTVDSVSALDELKPGALSTPVSDNGVAPSAAVPASQPAVSAPAVDLLGDDLLGDSKPAASAPSPAPAAGESLPGIFWCYAVLCVCTSNTTHSGMASILMLLVIDFTNQGTAQLPGSMSQHVTIPAYDMLFVFMCRSR